MLLNARLASSTGQGGSERSVLIRPKGSDEHGLSGRCPRRSSNSESIEATARQKRSTFDRLALLLYWPKR